MKAGKMFVFFCLLVAFYLRNSIMRSEEHTEFDAQLSRNKPVSHRRAFLSYHS